MNISGENRKKIIFIIIGIFVIALLPRLLVALHSTQAPLSDAIGYDDWAVNILEGRGFIDGQGQATSWKEPSYPFFLASVYYFFGHNYKAVRVIQAILGALICVAIFFIAGRTFDIKTGFIAALIACFNPSLIKISEYLLTENLFTFLLIAAIFFLLKQMQEQDYKNLIFLGFALGIATLTRSAIILFPLFILLFTGKRLVSRNPDTKIYISSVLILVFSFILTVSPWTLRNWWVHHKFVPVVSRMGLGIYSSFVPKDGKFFGFDASDETTQKSELIHSEVERSSFLVKETLKYIKDNPLQVLKVEILKILYFWSPFDWEIVGYGVYNFMYGFVLPFFILGVFTTFKRFKELLPVYLPIVYTFLISLITYGSPRFRLPVEPYIIIIGASGIMYCIHNFSKKTYAMLLISSCFLLNLLFYFKSYHIKIFVRSVMEKAYLW
ncbi:MAG: glycosyltransferase family 39 protein [Candidatus Omnitrophota bacterium]|nr:MAG: glycosyltransferase family 39 protein [Candidatus Omnitrophota bacterium]